MQIVLCSFVSFFFRFIYTIEERINHCSNTSWTRTIMRRREGTSVVFMRSIFECTLQFGSNVHHPGIHPYIYYNLHKLHCIKHDLLNSRAWFIIDPWTLSVRVYILKRVQYNHWHSKILITIVVTNTCAEVHALLMTAQFTWIQTLSLCFQY